MNTVIIREPDDQSAIAVMTTAELRTELAKGLTLTAATLQRLAYIWSELEKRGEDLSELRRGIAASLPLIATGALVAEVVVAFASRPSVLRSIVGLPHEQQRDLAAGKPVPLVTDAGEGEYAVKNLPVASLSAAQCRQVFGVGVIRDAEEQEALLEDIKRPKRRAKEEPTRQYNVRPDKIRDGVWIGKAFVSKVEMIAALSLLASDLDVVEPKGDRAATTLVVLTAEEKRRLVTAEKQNGEPEKSIVRKALRTLGLI